nr:helix-turn-helix transcriptional regulator [Clostridia bacterium]
MLYDRLLFISAEKMQSSHEVNYSERLAPRSALIVYMVSGKADARCDYDRWQLKDSDTLLVNERSDFSLTADPDAEFYIIRFAADFNGEVPFVMQSRGDYADAESDKARVIGMLGELCRISGSLDYPEEACDYLLRLLVIELGKRPHAENDDELYPRIMTYLEENSNTDLTVAGVAKEFGYSPDHLARSFKEYSGRGLKSAIDSVRLGCIRRMLAKEGLDNAALASECGFRNYKSLAEFFKYNTGMSIAAYRKGNK